MKIKNLLLPVYAIAALASCSQKDMPVKPENGDNKASEAKVSLKILGGTSPAATKATGNGPLEATTSEKTINNVTVFFFDGSGGLIGKAMYASNTETPFTFNTTTEAKKAVVITNIGSDQTGEEGLFAKTKVATLANLKTLDISSFNATTGKVNQTSTSLVSTGTGEVTMDLASKTGTATVPVRFLVAKINNVDIIHPATGNSGNKMSNVTEEQFLEGKLVSNAPDPRYKRAFISRIFLLKAQTNSPVLPATEDTWSGFTPNTDAFADGIKYGKDIGRPCNPTVGNAGIITDSYLAGPPAYTLLDGDNNETSDAKAKTTTFKNALGGPWYVFENTKETPRTSLVVEVIHKTKVSPERPTEISLDDFEYLYYPVIFGEGGTPALEAGKAYNVKITLNVNFITGPGEAGGYLDPTDPTSAAAPTPEAGNLGISVTVEPQDWILGQEVDKVFYP